MPVGIGLRHSHFQDALNQPANLDFIEVHSENFFAGGGAAPALLKEISNLYPVSLHGVSLGLGSAAGVAESHINALSRLVNHISPVMVSDHASFSWGQIENQLHHAGDLLPIAFNQQTLDIMSENIIKVQDHLNRQILVENLSSYIEPQNSTLSELEFFKALVKKTGCRMLLDINNLAVNATNAGEPDVLASINHWLEQIPSDHVHEIHLAGCTPVAKGEIMIDDHSQQVSELVWQAYGTAIARFGAVPTTIEWDTDLPQWHVLIGEANKARTIANAILQGTDRLTCASTTPAL